MAPSIWFDDHSIRWRNKAFYLEKCTQPNLKNWGYKYIHIYVYTWSPNGGPLFGLDVWPCFGGLVPLQIEVIKGFQQTFRGKKRLNSSKQLAEGKGQNTTPSNFCKKKHMWSLSPRSHRGMVTLKGKEKHMMHSWSFFCIWNLVIKIVMNSSESFISSLWFSALNFYLFFWKILRLVSRVHGDSPIRGVQTPHSSDGFPGPGVIFIHFSR